MRIFYTLLITLLIFVACDKDIAITESTIIFPKTTIETTQWQRNENEKMTWTRAIEYCDQLSLSGKTDWRLPQVWELSRLVDYTRLRPATNADLFPDTKSAYYWSATRFAGTKPSAWYVLFYSGGVGYADQMGMGHVRCVRGPTPEFQ